jgi:general secretion pathway protein I
VTGPRRRIGRGQCGFTLIEVLVALVVVAIGLAALMVTLSSTARTSGTLRDKTLAEWIALNRLSEVRLNLPKTNGQNADTGEINFGNRTWHYDTRYFDTSVASMKRVVVRVYRGDAKTKGNPIAESTGFLGSSLGTPGNSNSADWTQGATSASVASGGAATTPSASSSSALTPNSAVGNTPVAPATQTPTPAPTPTP